MKKFDNLFSLDRLIKLLTAFVNLYVKKKFHCPYSWSRFINWKISKMFIWINCYCPLHGRHATCVNQVSGTLFGWNLPLFVCIKYLYHSKIFVPRCIQMPFQGLSTQVSFLHIGICTSTWIKARCNHIHKHALSCIHHT